MLNKNEGKLDVWWLNAKQTSTAISSPWKKKSKLSTHQLWLQSKMNLWC